MTPFLIAGLCLALSALLVRGLDLWIGSGPAKFTDLTRPAEFVDQAADGPRQPNNALAFDAYLARLDARQVPRIRPLPENSNV